MLAASRSAKVGLVSLAQSKAELLSLQQIRCFCAALELGSFTAAADALRVSQPAVAEQVRKLEQALGADLFVRAGRGVVPTEAGPRLRRARRPQPARGRGRRRQRRRAHRAPRRHGRARHLRRARRPGASTSSWPRSCAATPTSPCGWSAATPRRSPSASGAASSRPASSCCRSTTTGSTCARSCATRCSTSAPRPSARGGPPRSSGSPRRRWSSTTPSPPTTTRSAASSPSARRRSASACSPKVEVELKDIALRLVAAGVGDTYLPSAYTRAPYYPAGLSTASFSPALYDTFAIITRAGRAALARRARAARGRSRRTCAPSPSELDRSR